MGAMRSAFSPATTITSSVSGWRARMAEERKVSPCQESKALSWPMRVEAPAARITPANDGAKRIEERYNLHPITRKGGARRGHRQSTQKTEIPSLWPLALGPWLKQHQNQKQRPLPQRARRKTETGSRIRPEATAKAKPYSPLIHTDER